MRHTNHVTRTRVRTRADTSFADADVRTQKGDDMTVDTGAQRSRQDRPGRRGKMADAVSSRGLSTGQAGDSNLDQVPLKLIRFRTVKNRTGLSRTTIWRLERTGAFPKHHRISANAVAWVEQDVVDWMRAKASAR